MTPNRTKKIKRCLNFRMPYGKHQGQKLDTIPTAYLEWVAREFSDDEIATCADLIVEWRKETGQ